MWKLYDKYFFDDHLSVIGNMTNTEIYLGFTPFENKTASYCIKQGCVYKILFSEKIFANLKGTNLIGSNLCDDKIHCCMLEMELAIIRYIIYSNPDYDSDNPIYDMNGAWFKRLIFAFFGITHQDYTLSHNSQQKFHIGQIVKYQYSDVDMIFGDITAINDMLITVNGIEINKNLVHHNQNKQLIINLI